MHTLVLFISILGGLKVFGLLGLVIGPVLAALFISFFDFYLAEIRRARTATMPTSSGPE
jgi:predicted PurR-regulated permease PerM